MQAWHYLTLLFVNHAILFVKSLSIVTAKANKTIFRKTYNSTLMLQKMTEMYTNTIKTKSP